MVEGVFSSDWSVPHLEHEAMREFVAATNRKLPVGCSWLAGPRPTDPRPAFIGSAPIDQRPEVADEGLTERTPFRRLGHLGRPAEFGFHKVSDRQFAATQPLSQKLRKVVSGPLQAERDDLQPLPRNRVPKLRASRSGLVVGELVVFEPRTEFMESRHSSFGNRSEPSRQAFFGNQ
jgi:hypothetical protein